MIRTSVYCSVIEINLNSVVKYMLQTENENNVMMISRNILVQWNTFWISLTSNSPLISSDFERQEYSIPLLFRLLTTEFQAHWLCSVELDGTVFVHLDRWGSERTLSWSVWRYYHSIRFERQNPRVTSVEISNNPVEIRIQYLSSTSLYHSYIILFFKILII